MAANDFTVLFDRLGAIAFNKMREKSILPRLVNRQVDAAPGTKGSTIQITVLSDITAVDVVPGHVAPDTAALVPTAISLVVDQWKEVPFTLTDKDLMQVSNGIIPQAVERAVDALVTAQETFLFGKFLQVPYENGTAGTTPFAVNATTGMNDMSAYINARKALNIRKVPSGDGERFALIDPDAAGNLLNGRQFIDAAWRGDTGGIIQGAIGFKLGANWAESNYVTANASTALTAGALTVNGVNAAGSATVSLAKATNAAPLKAGNTITIATGPAAGIYRVLADVTLIVGNTSVSITPGLRGATGGGEVVSLLATAVQNVLFHRDALAFVTRPLMESIPPGLEDKVTQSVFTDAVSGLAMRLEVSREYKQWRWSLDALYGGALVRPEFAQLMLG